MRNSTAHITHHQHAPPTLHDTIHDIVPKIFILYPILDFEHQAVPYLRCCYYSPPLFIPAPELDAFNRSHYEYASTPACLVPKRSCERRTTSEEARVFFFSFKKKEKKVIGLSDTAGFADITITVYLSLKTAKPTTTPTNKREHTMPPLKRRRSYVGSQRKLVIAFDIGTTYSGVSYAVLDPGLPPEIQSVTRYPAQQKVGGDCKIPSILYYDRAGNVRAIGAEATQESFLEQAEDEGFIKVEWFKLHLRPRTHASPSPPAPGTSGTSSIRDSDLPPLPPTKSPLSILSDFLFYLFTSTRTFIRETHPNGPEFWSRVEREIEYVFSLPNGWEGAQQAQIRKAAVMAGIVPDNIAGHRRVHFVTEGEASLHYCVNRGLLADGVARDTGVIVVDAGGGTLDISAYCATSSDSYEEIAPAQCRLQGSVFISRRAREYLQDRLKSSRYGSPEDVAHMTNVFDSTTKLTFRGGSQSCYIRFGSMRDRDSKVDIKAGQLKLPGHDIERFFQPPIEEIARAVQEQIQQATRPISAIFFVGGFAASDYMFGRLKEMFTQGGLRVLRPDGHLNKAVADGSVSYYIDHFVIARIAPVTYGVECCIQYDPSSAEHTKRATLVGPRPSGKIVLPHLFSPILRKGTRVTEDKEFREEFHQEAMDPGSFKAISTEILCYRGYMNNPKWLDSEPNMFTRLCTIVADTNHAAKGMTPQRSAVPGRNYYAQTFYIILKFGLTELKAQLGWFENGVEKRGPAMIIYDP